MTLYAGDTVRLEVEVFDPRTDMPLQPPPTAATVSLWEPGVPVTATPYAADLAMKAEGNVWVLDHDTTGMKPGTWTWRVTVTSSGRNSEYATFALHQPGA